MTSEPAVAGGIQEGGGDSHISRSSTVESRNNNDNNQKQQQQQQEEDEERYRCLVVDSGPIIRMGMSSLWNRADAFYTVPAVVREIRDAKARQHLENLPVELIQREPSPEGIQAAIEFSKQTGDYQSLSSVDMQVLGLLYDMEREGCLDMSHVRKTPKRVLGLGKIETLGGSSATATSSSTDPNELIVVEGIVSDDDESSVEELDEEEQNEISETGAAGGSVTTTASQQMPSSWAKIVNPTAADFVSMQASKQQESLVADFSKPFGKMNITGDSLGGQFSDAEEDGDGDEVDQCEEDETAAIALPEEEELKLEFPSLAASLAVPYEGSDDDNEGEEQNDEADVAERLRLQEEREEARKQEALRPVSKSGKLYNSFRKYGDLMKPKPAPKKEASTPKTEEAADKETNAEKEQPPADESAPQTKNQSRIIGGSTLAGQGADVEDDGEGWITCTNDVRKMKAAGALDPRRDPSQVNENVVASNLPIGPPISQRAACATTDFAMQNVILQMGLELLSVDGMKVRKLKSWVTRCGACFKVYTSAENNSATGPLGSKRLFCGHCGSDMMQRIAASVDGKTGRLRLHLSKKYKHNLRGTKYSLPKPGTGNRFQGDLLLREDQLLMGAWNQKVKMRSGGKAKSAAQSMFGKDIATNVGCHTRSLGDDDIRVGFGRRNPNAAKGRERRGKKKKSSDRACGMRRY